MMRVADYFAQRVAAAGSETAFMVSGGMMMHLIDAIGRVPSIRFYCNHHEQACAMAADGYARASGRPGLCYATSGPGATNLLTGLVGAYQDSIPIVFFTGQTKRRDTIRVAGIPGLRQMGLFEVDIVPIVQSVVKYVGFVDDPAAARFHVEKALHLCITGRPGPVLLDVPLDVQGAMIDPAAQTGYTPEPAEPFDAAAAAGVWDRVASARKPVILAGHGVRMAGMADEFPAWANRVGVPVVTTQLAKDLLPHDHPLFAGHPGVRGDRAANFALQTADLILAVGTSLHNQTIGWEPELFAPTAEKFHVDPDPAVLTKTRGIVTRQLRADVGRFLESFPEVGWPAAGLQAWRDRCQGWKQQYTSVREPHVHCHADGPANLYEVVDILSDLMTGREIILTDAGQPTYVCPQGLRLKAGHRFLAPGSLAEMGWALPAALGAATAAPDRPVVVVVGDGSLQTNLQEFQTLRHNNWNVKVIVINNDGYASIRATQTRFFDRFFVGSTQESGVSVPPWDKIAAAYGLRHVLCPARSALRAALSEALSTPGPVLCEVMAIRDQEVIPGVPSARQADGTMRSVPIHLMAPPLPETELAKELRNDGEGVVG